ncbi:MAG: GHKL domain-containing protein [Alphaproteobacteria bacterium]|nr:GHKL domain-containing protein [Alphaproteobacteria bacterium]
MQDDSEVHNDIAKSQLRTLLGSLIDDVLLEINHDMTIMHSNAAGISLLGDDLIGSDLCQRLTYTDLKDDFHSAIATKKIVEFTTTPSGFSVANRFRQLRGRMLYLDETTVIVLLMDMTLQHNLEKMRRDFIANVSHELRSPLTSLIGFVETMQGSDDMETQTRDRFLGIMADEAKRMSRLIDDLMSLAKVENEEHIAPMARVFIENIVQSVIVSLTRRVQETGREIIFTDRRNYTDQAPIILGETDAMTEVFHNLIDNAIKYSFPESTISVDMLTNNANDTLTINITNHGEGIEEKHIPRLTERFYRVDKGRSRQMGGTGLGLAIVKHIINKHRGELIITSTLNEKTVFSVILPLAQ